MLESATQQELRQKMEQNFLLVEEVLAGMSATW